MAQFPAVSIGDAAGLRDVGTLHSQLLPLSQAVEILTGQRGNTHAVMTDEITVSPQNWVLGNQIKDPGAGVTTAAGGVPTYTDYINTVRDLYQLREDVVRIQGALNALLTNLRT